MSVSDALPLARGFLRGALQGLAIPESNTRRRLEAHPRCHYTQESFRALTFHSGNVFTECVSAQLRSRVVFLETTRAAYRIDDFGTCGTESACLR